jgi:hypothetical protein
MKKLLNKFFKRLGYVPEPTKPIFSLDVYTVYKEKINELHNESEYYKKFAYEKNEQLPELLKLAEIRIDALRKENNYLYSRLKEHNLLWNDASQPYILPYDEEFFDQLEKEAIWKSSTAKKSKKSRKQEN